MVVRTPLALTLSAALCGLSFAGFTPTTVAVSPDGTKAVADLPASQHMRNVGGSDGAGLCVFTSVEHAARWQAIDALDGFQSWMRRRPGGGWPQKLDQMIASYCREQGKSVPGYIQHTGGDESFLELALHTDRIVCVTYAGRDDFYRGRIAHMVNLAHLDETRAAIIDNNRPGVWVWMTRAEFLARWRDMDGGWAVAFLADPPPPHPGAKAAKKVEAACSCDDCKCKAGTCPNKCPVRAFGQCPGGQCPTVAPLATAKPAGDGWQWSFIPNVGYCWNRPAVQAPPAAVDCPAENYGVECGKIHGQPAYAINGVEVTQAVALTALAGGNPLADDSDRWHLTAVGTPEFLARVRSDVAVLSAETRNKLLIKCYAPDRWEVSAFALPAGVNLRKPSPVRTAPDVGTVGPNDYTPAKLGGLLSAPGGPIILPTPDPKPVPDPTGPDPAKPTPAPAPTPAPQPDPNQSPWAALILAVVAILFSIFKTKK